MLGIPYRVHQLQRLRRNRQVRHNQRAALSETRLRYFISESGLGPPVMMQRMSGWTFGSRLMAGVAVLVLVTGIILTLLTINSNLELDTYRPVIFTILGILFIVLGPMVVCRMVLNAYDRRLAREQRHFVRFFSATYLPTVDQCMETLARQLRRREVQTQAGESHVRHDGDTQRRGAQLVFDYFIQTAAGRRSYTMDHCNARDISAEDIYPGPLPSYESALQLKDNEHWSAKFFSGPPPPYTHPAQSVAECAIEMATYSVRERVDMPHTHSAPDDHDEHCPAQPLADTEQWEAAIQQQHQPTIQRQESQTNIYQTQSQSSDQQNTRRLHIV